MNKDKKYARVSFLCMGGYALLLFWLLLFFYDWGDARGKPNGLGPKPSYSFPGCFRFQENTLILFAKAIL